MKHINVTPITDLDGEVITVMLGKDKTAPLTVPYVLTTLVNRWIGQLNAQNCTMQDSLMAMRLKDAVREWERFVEAASAAKEEQPCFSLEDADYDYWQQVIEAGAPKIFVLYAVKVKTAFENLRK